MDGHLRDIIMPIGILGTIGGSIYMFTKVMTDYILKKRMIEKGFVNDDTQAIFKQHGLNSKASSLQWGLILFFAGLALIVMEYIQVDSESPLPYGLVTVAVSLGFLVNYFLSKKE